LPKNISSKHFAALALAAFLSLPAAALAELDLPVNGPITSGVGWRLDPFGTGKMLFHRGIDIAVPTGTPVKATRKGKVVFAGERKGYGATVIVEHDDGGRTMYGHNSLVRVASGEMVEAGAVVALSGNSGRSTGPHVHYEEIAGKGGGASWTLAAARSGKQLTGKGMPTAKRVSAAGSETREVAQVTNEQLLAEQKLDESLDAVLKVLRAGTTGPGG
jgi:murein DD-endopeptidase MepM/ murein hydrolase activator NlpD